MEHVKLIVMSIIVLFMLIAFYRENKKMKIIDMEENEEIIEAKSYFDNWVIKTQSQDERQFIDDLHSKGLFSDIEYNKRIQELEETKISTEVHNNIARLEKLKQKGVLSEEEFIGKREIQLKKIEVYQRELPRVKIIRSKSWIGRALKVAVIIDGDEVAKIANDSEAYLKTSLGEHCLYFRSGTSLSEKVYFEANYNQTIEIDCLLYQSDEINIKLHPVA